MKKKYVIKLFFVILANMFVLPLWAQECRENYEKAEMYRKKG